MYTWSNLYVTCVINLINYDLQEQSTKIHREKQDSIISINSYKYSIAEVRRGLILWALKMMLIFLRNVHACSQVDTCIKTLSKSKYQKLILCQKIEIYNPTNNTYPSYVPVRENRSHFSYQRKFVWSFFDKLHSCYDAQIDCATLCNNKRLELKKKTTCGEF
jgi:hypothetical protein